jgi:dephospho-CoA kinase
MMENAIIVEGKTYKLFDHIILVNAPLSLRRQRIMKRDGMTKEKMELIIKNQKKPRYIASKINSEGIKCYYFMNDETWDVKNRVQNLIELFGEKFK